MIHRMKIELASVNGKSIEIGKKPADNILFKKLLLGDEMKLHLTADADNYGIDCRNVIGRKDNTPVGRNVLHADIGYFIS